MALTTLAELVAAGAHRSIEQIVAKGDYSIARADQALLARYGSEYRASLDTVIELVNQVQRGTFLASRIGPGTGAATGLVPDLPSLPPGYNYTVIATIRDQSRPLGLDRTIDIPVSILSPKELTYEEIQAEVDRQLADLAAQGGGQLGAGVTESEKRRGQVAEIIRDQYGGEAMPEIDILSVYRGV